MSSILKGKDKWLSVDDHNAKQVTGCSCAYKLLEDALYLWVISNGPSGKGGDIGGDAIREMALELAKDSRFGVDPSFKFSHGWFEGFKRRYKLKSYRRNGEGASSDAAAVSNGQDQIASVIA